ncbi:hypothetical protein KSP39_PZI013717 [Platanthera zijinensis]|uniref:Uncharacterized protein n=1 Tax=Platanthera zijinensis TaxID=2320716 RepID=A0AAP0BDP1_9ASPA
MAVTLLCAGTRAISTPKKTPPGLLHFINRAATSSFLAGKGPLIKQALTIMQVVLTSPYTVHKASCPPAIFMHHSLMPYSIASKMNRAVRRRKTDS